MQNAIWDERDFNGCKKIILVIFIFVSIIQLLATFHTRLWDGEYELVFAPRFYTNNHCFFNIVSEWWTIEIVSGVSKENIKYAGEYFKNDSYGKLVKSESAGVCVSLNGVYKFKTGAKNNSHMSSTHFLDTLSVSLQVNVF